MFKISIYQIRKIIIILSDKLAFKYMKNKEWKIRSGNLDDASNYDIYYFISKL